MALSNSAMLFRPLRSSVFLAIFGFLFCSPDQLNDFIHIESPGISYFKAGELPI